MRRRALLGGALLLFLASPMAALACSQVPITPAIRAAWFREADAVVIAEVTRQDIHGFDPPVVTQTGTADAKVVRSLKGRVPLGTVITYQVNYLPTDGMTCNIDTRTTVGGIYRFFLKRGPGGGWRATGWELEP